MKIESEKVLEAKLRDKVKSLGGWCIKLVPIHIAGLPDRLCMFLGGRVVFAEIKTTKKKPEPKQRVVIKKLRKMGFRVEIIDRSEQIEKLIEDYA